MAKILKIDKDFTPCEAIIDDELYPNGIFVFNITKILEYIQSGTGNITLEEVAVGDFYKEFSSINEDHVDSVDISVPVLLAEIAPGRFNLIDGNHRMEKARRLKADSIHAYKLNANQHLKYLTSIDAYLAYIQYWNDKVQQYRFQNRK